VGFGVLFTFIASFTYVSFHLAAAPYHLSPTGLGAIFVTYLTGVVTTLLTGRGVARFGRRRLVIGLTALWAAGMALTLLPSLPAIVAGLAVCAGCGFVCQAVATGSLPSPRARGAPRRSGSTSPATTSAAASAACCPASSGSAGAGPASWPWCWRCWW
jgi:predicted MFS family arabinose efflux permease